jgi:uracil-DNA glycosylase
MANRAMQLPPKWQAFIQDHQRSDYFKDIENAIAEQRASGVEIYPKDSDILNAFSYFDVDEIKVVILGQDPYHGPDQAQGLAFSVNDDQKVPPSLVNIYKELAQDIEGFVIPAHGNLTTWAEQGVLLLNTVLTVQRGKAHSHSKLGWEKFSDAVIAKINAENSNCVFLLWGAHAQQKGRDIDTQKHYVLNAVHPSPLSAYRGFMGCQHFSLANQWLVSRGLEPIDWKIENVGTMDLF